MQQAAWIVAPGGLLGPVGGGARPGTLHEKMRVMLEDAVAC